MTSIKGGGGKTDPYRFSTNVLKLEPHFQHDNATCIGFPPSQVRRRTCRYIPPILISSNILVTTKRMIGVIHLQPVNTYTFSFLYKKFFFNAKSPLIWPRKWGYNLKQIALKKGYFSNLRRDMSPPFLGADSTGAIT